MADATPINPPEAASTKARKGASAGVSPEVMAEVKDQAVVEMPTADVSYKVAGGVELVSHSAVREDF